MEHSPSLVIESHNRSDTQPKSTDSLTGWVFFQSQTHLPKNVLMNFVKIANGFETCKAQYKLNHPLLNVSNGLIT